MNTATKPELAKRRFGLMRVKVESNHVIRVGGVKQQVRARERSRFPEATVTWICTFCRDHNLPHEWKTEAALMAAHPERSRMVKQEEAHVFYGWSNDPEPSALAALQEELEAKADAIQRSGASKEDTDRQLAGLKAEKARRAAALPKIGMLTEDEVL